MRSAAGGGRSSSAWTCVQVVGYRAATGASAHPSCDRLLPWADCRHKVSPLRPQQQRRLLLAASVLRQHVEQVALALFVHTQVTACVSNRQVKCMREQMKVHARAPPKKCTQAAAASAPPAAPASRCHRALPVLGSLAHPEYRPSRFPSNAGSAVMASAAWVLCFWAATAATNSRPAARAVRGADRMVALHVHA